MKSNKFLSHALMIKYPSNTYGYDGLALGYNGYDGLALGYQG